MYYILSYCSLSVSGPYCHKDTFIPLPQAYIKHVLLFKLGIKPKLYTQKMSDKILQEWRAVRYFKSTLCVLHEPVMLLVRPLADSTVSYSSRFKSQPWKPHWATPHLLMPPFSYCLSRCLHMAFSPSLCLSFFLLDLSLALLLSFSICMLLIFSLICNFWVSLLNPFWKNTKYRRSLPLETFINFVFWAALLNFIHKRSTSVINAVYKSKCYFNYFALKSKYSR